jgi:hypothetical protein
MGLQAHRGTTGAVRHGGGLILKLNNPVCYWATA